VSSSAILVTGGAGYVGAHTCKALRSAGFIPVVLDNLSTGHRSFVRWGPFVPGDVRDTDAVCHTIGAYKIEAVLHFAASAYVGESVADPQKYYENNVGGSLSLLRAMLEAGCRRLVFSSTCAIYGEPAEIPIGEMTPQNPVNPYGASPKVWTRRRSWSGSGPPIPSRSGAMPAPSLDSTPRCWRWLVSQLFTGACNLRRAYQQRLSWLHERWSPKW